MKIVNNSQRLVSLSFRDGRTINVPESGGSVTLADSDFTYLDDTAATLALFSAGLLTLRATDGGPWAGTPLPATPNQQPGPMLANVLVDQTNTLRRADSGDVVGGGVGAGLGLRLQSGRMERDVVNSANYTWEDVIALSGEFDAVRLIWGQSRNAAATTTAPNMLAYVAAVPDAALATTDSATWTQATVGGAGVWPLAIGPAQYRRSYVVSDLISTASLPRTDGGRFALLAVRSWVNGGTLTLWGDSAGNDHSTNWATKPDGRIWRRRRLSGNHANTATFNASAAACDESPLLGVQYVARGRVVSVAFFGDSIIEGRGTYIGEGYAIPACAAMASESVVFEPSQLGWSGVNTGTILSHLTDFLAAGLAVDAVVFPSGSPNDVTTTITDAQIQLARFRLAQAQAQARNARVPLIMVPWLASNYSAKPYGATDSKRRAYAADVEARAAQGLMVPALASAVAGDVDGNGQQTLPAAYSLDGVHPSDPGNDVLASAMSPVLRRLI